MNDSQRPYNGQIDETLLTAYALEQLDGPERALVEAALKTDHKAQEAVEEIRAVAGHLREAVVREDQYAPSAALRQMIENRLEGAPPAVETEDGGSTAAETRIAPGAETTAAAARRRRWAVFAVASAAVLLLAVAIPSLPMFHLGKPSQMAMDMAPAKTPAPAAEPVAAGLSAETPPGDGAGGGAFVSGEFKESTEAEEMMAMPAEAPAAAREADFAGKAAGDTPRGDTPRGETLRGETLRGEPAKDFGSYAAEDEVRDKSSAVEKLAESAGRPVAKGDSHYSLGGAAVMESQEAAGTEAAPARANRQGNEAKPADSATRRLRVESRALAEPAKSEKATSTPAWSYGQAVGPGATPLPYPATPPAAGGQMPLAQSPVMPRAKSAGPMAGPAPVSAESAPPTADPNAAAAGRPGLPAPVQRESLQQQVQVRVLPRNEPATEALSDLDVQVFRGRAEQKKQQPGMPALDRYAAGYGAGGYGGAAAAPAGEGEAVGQFGDALHMGKAVPGYGRNGVAGPYAPPATAPAPAESILQLGMTAEQYAPVVENPFQSPMTEPESTVSADVDTASYANVRRFLENNQPPPPGAVRVEEMVNYFSYEYPPPKDDAPFSVDIESASCPWNESHRLVRIGLKAKEIDPAERGPSNLVFLLDVSGSMRDANKLPLVKDAMAMLVDQLTEDDRVSIVTYAGDAGVALPATEGTRRKEILERIEALQAGGSTHGSAGIQLAYDLAMANFVAGGSNRVILCTDGDLNVGITDDNELVKLIQQKATGGVFLTVVGFGTGNLKDAKLEQIADKGNGKYAYVDGLKEAKKVFAEQVSGSLVTVAKDVKIQVEFNPAKVQSYRLVGYENRLLGSQDFADDTKDAGEIGAGHSVTYLYEVVPANLPVGQIAALNNAGPNLRYQRFMANALTEVAESGELLALKLRYKLPDEQQSRLLELPVKDSGKRFAEATSEFRFAAAVAAFGMLLRGSQYNQGLTFSAVEEFAAGAADNDRQGRRGEFVELVRRARALYGDGAQVGADAVSAPPAAAAPTSEVQTPAERDDYQAR